MEYIELTTTCENHTIASKLAKIIIEHRYAACVQLCPIESYYIWENEVCISQEVKLSCKTMRNIQESLQDLICKHSSYDLPQIIVTPIIDGTNAYLEWIKQSILETKK
ncbi:hypothetical protein CCZ01_05470 [Helicobacter monodelphidis]|uniref:divalent-cation tolerance protein CutA n=1 Tax=Helicobacter sp. 15-1451 TaxID=2004995 RepID=UPI000DCB1C49|nr:divalent-cation tolerance protein CutA [Helicobacter sp. 15-1451]RAX57591.1 hypothetical protein CCZ01_05470 [Helicobacter sp. 15-1451]